MEIHQLRYAAEVHRRGSFTAAADVLHVSQSGVSAQVAKLERELGVRLFERGPRAATPTTDGAVLLSLMSTVLTDLSQITRATDDLFGLVRGTVRIGTVIGCTIPGYLDAFTEFRSAHPGVSVSASEGNSSALVSRLISGDLDLALLAHTGELPSELAVTTIVDEPIAVGVPAGDPWEDRTSVAVGELAAADLLTLAAGTGVRAALEQTCGHSCTVVSPAVEAHSPETVHALAERGAGVAVLSTSMISAPLTAVPIQNAQRAKLSLTSHRTPGHAARVFIEMLDSGLREPGTA